jgi:endonuclease YncB( thermonuclease family)
MNKPLAAFVAVLLLGGGAGAIALGGGALRQKVEPLTSQERTAEAPSVTAADEHAIPKLRSGSDALTAEAPSSSQPATTFLPAAKQPIGVVRPPTAVPSATADIPTELPAIDAEPAAQATAPSQPQARAVAPAEVPEPSAEPAGLQRIEPRAALSEIGQALPPKPKMPDEWKGTTLFNPVATAAGSLEAKGYTIAIAGVEPVSPDEACDSGGKSWPCGIRARAAFRAWLRGRSVVCDVPPQPDRETIVVPCKVGKKDVAQWLVESGWARATSDGPYAGLQDAALKARKGIYGAPPATSASSVSNAGSSLPAPSDTDNAILSAPSPEPQQEVVTSPLLERPIGNFPAAPPPPTVQAPQ